MNNSQVAHLWAHQQQDRATGSNFYFEGDKIYSYGSHFCAGKIFANIVLINSSGYSVTTSKHMGYVRSAVFQDYIAVPDPDPSYKGEHETNLKYLFDSAKKNLEQSFKRRKSNIHIATTDLATCAWYLANFDKYARLFKCKTTSKKFNIKKIHDDYTKAINDFDSVAGPYKEMARKQYLARQAKLDRQAKKDIKKFRDYSLNFVHGLKYQLIRIMGDTVRTSLGASVSLESAVNLFRFIVKRNWEKFSDRSMSIGNFHGISLSNNVLTIGCHKIQRKEIERFISQETGI